MSSPIYSRATGRSGPKSKTGCSTCRRRKVRCDEGRPICANCMRLKISCGFLEYHPRSSGNPRRASRLKDSTARPRLQQEAVNPSCEIHNGGSQDSFCNRVSMIDSSTLASSAFQNEDGTSSSHMSAITPVNEGHGSNSDVPREFYLAQRMWGVPDNDILDLHQASDSSFPETLPFQDVFISSLDSTDMGLSNHFGFQQDETPAHPVWLTPDTQAPLGQTSFDQMTSSLLEHFTEASNPIAVIVPTHLEWTTASRTLLSMAQSSPTLLDAICAHSALHLYICEKDNDMLDVAFNHYQSSSSQVTIFFQESCHSAASPRVNNPDLKKAFAAVFLLSHIELIAQSTPRASVWPLQHIHAAHTRVRQYSSSIQTWAGTSRRLLTWMTLLQNKAEYNGGTPCGNGKDDGSLELSSSKSSTQARSTDSTVDQTQDESVFAQSSHSPGGWSTVIESPSPSELLGEILNQPALEFHLRAQSFTPRIIALDKHHHRRGTLESDFEILKRGHTINAGLHSLWEQRPAIFSLLEEPAGIEDVLQPSYGRVVLRNLRVYSANFWAHYIYLHRVAFVVYPASDDVTQAVLQISTLARALTADLNQTDSSSIGRDYYETSRPSPSHDEIHLPHSMFWPLFMLCLECPTETRGQFLHMMRQICCLPNINKGVLLLEEVLRRQDRASVRIDHRDVRKELFDSELSVIY